MMSNYYVRQVGATVHKRDERLIVTKDDRQVDEIPLHRLDQLVVMGDVQVTTQAMGLLFRRGVDVVLMTRGGRVLGRVVANESRYAELRLRQYQTLSDPERSRQIAQQIVAGKLINQLAVLQQRGLGSVSVVAASGRGVALLPDPVLQARAYSTALSGIREMLARTPLATDRDTLMGFEGKAAAWYWPAFRLLLKDDMGFRNRIYYPPTDPINALLSFGYALLQKDVLAAIQVIGLDPYLGCFHTVQYGRPSLALDVMEEFRPVMVDALVLGLVNGRVVRRGDFVRGAASSTSTSTSTMPSTVASGGNEVVVAQPAGRGLGTRMNDAALRQVILAYETRAASSVVYPRTGEQTTLRRCIELQVRRLARVLKGEEGDYGPFVAVAEGR